ncbi:hypothetical protein BYT27DRAFT_7253570 [Phlegmacium glaucopus]|nr:hypothetical protein BYT27DRAFT_7253570 [Phlegmacium glaucopus]
MFLPTGLTALTVSPYVTSTSLPPLDPTSPTYALLPPPSSPTVPLLFLSPTRSLLPYTPTVSIHEHSSNYSFNILRYLPGLLVSWNLATTVGPDVSLTCARASNKLFTFKFGTTSMVPSSLRQTFNPLQLWLDLKCEGVQKEVLKDHLVTSVEPAVTQARAIQPVPVTELAPALATEPVPTDRPAPPSPMLTLAEATDPAPAPVIERTTEVQPAPPTPILQPSQDLEDQTNAAGTHLVEVAPVPVEMPAPPAPIPSAPPTVTLQPPTPQTSQEAAALNPTTLLVIPPNPLGPAAEPTRSRSRSRSPVPPITELRWSPHLQSLAPEPIAGPSGKRPGDPLINEPAPKKRRED